MLHAMKQLGTIVVLSLALIACKGGGEASRGKPAERTPVAPTPAPAAPAPVAPAPVAPAPVAPAAVPAAAFLASADEAVADGAAPVALAGGRASVAVVTRPGAHGPVAIRAVVDGKRVELFAATTGDCGGGTVIETDARDGAAVIKLGQLSYTSCDDDTRGLAARDIDSHVECARLTWSEAKGAVDVERSPKVVDDDALPGWCREATAAAPAPAAAAAPAAAGTENVCCENEVSGPEWHARTECEVNDWKIVDDSRCPKP